MGWWSTDIMGGDTPLDYRCEIYEMVGISDYYDVSREVKKEKLKSLIPLIENETIFKDDDYIPVIGFQVLAVELMDNEVSISDKAKKVLIRNIKKDDWNDKERIKTINALVDKVKNYTGERIIVKSKGLFEVINDKLNK
jgi:hypothetical protein